MRCDVLALNVFPIAPAMWPQQLAADPVRLVVVGARGGLAPPWNSLGSGLRALLVEPDPVACAALQHPANPHWQVAATALAQQAQSRTLHVCQAPELTSLFQPNHAWLAQFPCAPQFTVTHTAPIMVNTLDAVLSAYTWPSADFIQLDAQGAELAILQGGVSTLAQTIGVEVEVAFGPIYLEQPLFAAVDSFLRDQHFELFDLRRYFWKRQNEVLALHSHGQLACGEALYLRPPAQVLQWPHLTPGQLVRACAVYALYGQADLGLQLLPALPSALQTSVRQALASLHLPASSFRSARLSRWLQWCATRLAPLNSIATVDPPLGSHNWL